jgi:MFS family permease
VNKKHKKHTFHYKTIGWFICSLAALFYCYEYLLRIAPSVMVTDLMKTFHINAGSLGLLAAMYYYAYTPLQAVAGMIVDYFGPRRILITAIVFCIAGSWTFSGSHSIYIASIGRFFIGFGSAFAFVGVLKLAAIWLPHERFSTFVGITTGLGMLGAMIGDVTMSRALNYMHWRTLLMSGVYIGIVLFIFFYLFVREHRPKKTLKSKVLYLPLNTLYAEFIKILCNRQLWLIGLIGCMNYLSLTVFAEMWGITFINSVHHIPNHLAARVNSFVFLGWLVGSPFNGWLSNAVCSRRKILIVGSLLGTVMISIILFFPHMPLKLLMLSLFCYGLFSSCEILCFVMARENVKLKVAATAISFINFLVMFGGIILQPLVGRLLDWQWTQEWIQDNIRVYSISHYQKALIIIPILMVLSTILSFCLKETYKKSYHF